MLQWIKLPKGSSISSIRSHSFYLFISSFVLGVALRSFSDIFSLLGPGFLVFILMLSVAVFLIDRKFLTVSILLILFFLGMLRMDFSLQREFAQDNFLGREILIAGIIVDEPSERENSTQIVLRPENSDEKILIITEKASLFQYGDLISVKGFLRSPENFTTDNNREFDYINYLSKDEIFYQMLFPDIEIIKSGEGNFFKEKLFSMKGFLISKINKVIPSPESEYLGGLVFGAKESLGKDLEEDFRRTGLIHVVVLSGYNVTIIANSILKSLSFLPQSVGLSFGVLSIIAFALMTGASATIVRASIMAILVIVGKASGRSYSINRSLFLAGFLMVLHNPKILIFDPSFQLSFLATLGLIHFSPILYQNLKFIPEKFQIRELISTTLATQVFVIPLLLNKIGDISLIAPLSNLLVLPFIPPTMFLGFLTSVLGIISDFLSLLPGFVSFILLSYQIKVVELFSGIPFASIKIDTFPFWAMLIVYLLYFFLYKKSNITEKS